MYLYKNIAHFSIFFLSLFQSIRIHPLPLILQICVFILELYGGSIVPPSHLPPPRDKSLHIWWKIPKPPLYTLILVERSHTHTHISTHKHTHTEPALVEKRWNTHTHTKTHTHTLTHWEEPCGSSLAPTGNSMKTVLVSRGYPEEVSSSSAERRRGESHSENIHSLSLPV